MLIEIKQILPAGEMIIKLIKPTGQFTEKQPEEGKKYTVYFEKVEADKIPEFNQ